MPRRELVPLKSLKFGDNPRRFFKGLPELAALIKRHGAVMPPWITPDRVIIAGERRVRALQLINKEDGSWSEVECDVYDTDEPFDLSVVENLGRQDFAFIEVARIFERYHQEGLTNDQIAEKTTYNRDTVQRYLAILNRVHPDIIARLDNGEEIPVNKLIELHFIKDKEVQKVRLEQWHGAPRTETEAQPSRERKAGLSRKRQLKLIRILQDSGASDEAIQVAQYMAGMRTTLPHKWHLKLSQRAPRQFRS